MRPQYSRKPSHNGILSPRATPLNRTGSGPAQIWGPSFRRSLLVYADFSDRLYRRIRSPPQTLATAQCGGLLPRSRTASSGDLRASASDAGDWTATISPAVRLPIEVPHVGNDFQVPDRLNDTCDLPVRNRDRRRARNPRISDRAGPTSWAVPESPERLRPASQFAFHPT